MAGDFNCVDNPMLDRSNFDEKRFNKYRSDSLDDIRRTFEFKDALTSVDAKANVFTWVGPTVATRLD